MRSLECEYSGSRGIWTQFWFWSSFWGFLYAQHRHDICKAFPAALSEVSILTEDNSTRAKLHNRHIGIPHCWDVDDLGILSYDKTSTLTETPPTDRFFRISEPSWIQRAIKSVDGDCCDPQCWKEFILVLSAVDRLPWLWRGKAKSGKDNVHCSRTSCCSFRVWSYLCCSKPYNHSR